MNLWDKVLHHAERRVNPHSFATWFRPTRQERAEENRLVIRVPTRLFRKRLTETYGQLLQAVLAEVGRPGMTLEFICAEAEPVGPAAASVSQAKLDFESSDNQLNPRYTFANFIVGSANRLAHAAALSVAEKPGHAYNPLFLYGGVGLGKTHLMHAIVNQVIAKFPRKRVVYATSEKFTNEFITSIQQGKIDEFRARYRRIDLLLIDDIQFIADKERTQEEFFHTFNAIHEDGKQIVLSSDRPPKAILTLEERLRSAGFAPQRQEVEEERYNLVTTMGSAPPRLYLVGHVDTVAAWDLEEYGPQEQGGVVQGLGTADMKGGCAAMLEAWLALGTLPEAERPPLGLLLVVGEEESGDGSAVFLRDARPSWVVIGEPTGLAACFAHYGYLEAGFVTRGRRSHSSLPELGHNAVESMLRVLLHLARDPLFDRPQSGIVYSIRELSSSRAGFVVPDRCETWIDLHLPPDADPAAVSGEAKTRWAGSDCAATVQAGSAATPHKMARAHNNPLRTRTL